MSSSTSTSKRWLLTYALTLLVAIGLGWLYAGHFEPETKFWVEVFEKRRSEMNQKSDQAQVLFTGDSACSFGVDPQIFTMQTGIPSMNLGGSRQMGTSVFMEETLRVVKSGDTIVMICNPNLLVSDYDLAREGQTYTKAGAQMAIALSMEPSLLKVQPGTQPGFNHLLSHAAKIALRKPLLRYQIEDYRAQGLVTTKSRDHPPGNTKLFSLSDAEIAKCLATLNRWNVRCAEKEVTLCYLLPLEFTDKSILLEGRKNKEAFLQTIQKMSEVDYSPITFLRTPEGANSSIEAQFSDTLFHLTEEGAASFTRALTPEVKAALKN